MAFYLMRFVGFILSPALWILGLLAIALFVKNQKQTKKILIFCLLITFIFSNDFLVETAFHCWEIPQKQVSTIVKPFDYAIIMGGMSGWDEEFKRLNFTETSDRMAQAFDLYKRGKIKKIILSGGAANVKKSYEREAPHVKAYLIRWGIPEADILMDSTSRNTHENAQNVKHMFYSDDKVYLVITSSSHMRRTLQCFKGVKMKVTAWPVDFHGSRKGEFKLAQLFVPNTKSFREWDFLIHEWLGYIGYWAAGYY